MTDFSMFKFINKSINFSNFNLLIIGSDELTDKIDNLFKDLGFNIYKASTIDKANKAIKDNKIEYVILDAEIVSNSDIIKLLSLNDIKVVILTKNIDTEFQKTCYKKGAIDFIFKDKNLMSKMSDVPKIIQRIEKNSTENIVIINNNNCSFISEMNSVLKKRNFNIDYINDYHHIIEKINNGSKIDLIIFDLDKENFNYISIINGDYFNQDIFKKTENKIDKKLLENIKNARLRLLAQGINKELANALLGRIIFIRYLIDRKVKYARIFIKAIR